MQKYQCLLLLLVRTTVAFIPQSKQVKYRNGINKDTRASKLQASVIHDWDSHTDLIAGMANESKKLNGLSIPDSNGNDLEPKSDNYQLAHSPATKHKEALLESIATRFAAATSPDVIYPRLRELPNHPKFGDTLNDITDLQAQAISFLETKSRPKRKPIFDFYQPLSIQACHQIQFGVNMLALSGILGYFRIPPNAPPARRLPFTLAAFANVFFALTLSSSLNALPEGYWHFDAFSGLGLGVIAATYFGTAISMISAMDNAISGPDCGLQSTPGGMNRGINILFTALIYFFVNGAQIPLVAPIFFSDLDAYQQSMSVAFESAGMASLDFHSFATAVGFVSFLSFVSTLQFEKKISETTGMLLFVSLFLVFNCDAIIATYKTMFCSDLLPILESSNHYLSNMIADHNLIEWGALITGLVVLNSLRKLFTADGIEKGPKSKHQSVVPTMMMKD